MKSSRRIVLKAAVAMTSLAAAATACTSADRVGEAPLMSSGDGSRRARRPLRTRQAPFTGEPPRVAYLRAEPLNPAGLRWLAGARQQAALAGLDLTHDETSVDGPTLVNALRALVADEATSGVIVAGDGLAGAADLEDALAEAGAVGVPVVAQSSVPSLVVAGTVLVDDEQLMRTALESLTLASGSKVGSIAPIQGYGRLDRRGDAWDEVCNERGWAQLTLPEEAAASVSTVPDDGATTRIVSATLLQARDMSMVGAPNAFLLAATGSAIASGERPTPTTLVGVLDANEWDVDIESLWGPEIGQAVVSTIDPALLGATTVRATALLIAGLEKDGMTVRVPGQLLTDAELRQVSAHDVADIFPLLEGQRPSQQPPQLVTPWLPALEATRDSTVT